MQTKEYDSVTMNLDEQIDSPPELQISYEVKLDNGTTITEMVSPPDYVPTYERCVELGAKPKYVVDILATHKGTPRCGVVIEIVHKHQTPRKKVEDLHRMGFRCVLEVSADWILNQVDVPEKIAVRRWLIKDSQMMI